METEGVRFGYCTECSKPLDNHLSWCSQPEKRRVLHPTPKIPWKPKPDHYAKHKIDPWIFCLENELDFATGNVIKYVVRHKDKNGAEDLDKAIRCLQMMKEFYYEKE